MSEAGYLSTIAIDKDFKNAYDAFQNQLAEWRNIQNPDERAHTIIKDLFGEKRRRNLKSTAYDHMMKVANEISRIYKDPELTIIAMLHDSIEDSALTLKDIKDLGFSDRVIKALDALTKRPGEKYMNYIQRLSANDDARLIKLEDIRANSQDGGMNPNRQFFLYPFALAYMEEAASLLLDGASLPNVRKFAIDHRKKIAKYMPKHIYNEYILLHSSANDNQNQPQPSLVAA
jgi:hypothetical protein